MSSRDNVYDINVRRLALLTLPTIWRRPIMGALIYAAVTPIARYVGELRAFRKEKRYRLTHNGQVCRLRGVLNDEFDPEQRRIDIEEGAGVTPSEASRLWLREEARWIIVPRRAGRAVSVHPEGFNGIGGYDFWVSLPEGLSDRIDDQRLRAIVNTYRLASRRFGVAYDK